MRSYVPIIGWSVSIGLFYLGTLSILATSPPPQCIAELFTLDCIGAGCEVEYVGPPFFTCYTEENAPRPMLCRLV